MKKISIMILLVAFLLPCTLHAENGLTASFKSGFPLSGTSFGVKVGPLNPYGGIDIARISGTYESSSKSWYNNRLDYQRSSTLEGSATLFMPHAGLKFYLWKAYLLGEVMMCIPAVSGEDKGERIYYDYDGNIDDIDTWDYELEDEEKDMLKDALDFFGLKVGFGVEHYLSERVSIGGEFGLRMLLNDINSENSDQDWDEDYSYRDEWSEDVSAMLGVTYTSFSINFIL